MSSDKNFDEINEIVIRQDSLTTQIIENYNRISSMEFSKQINERISQRSSFATQAIENFNRISCMGFEKQISEIIKTFSRNTFFTTQAMEQYNRISSMGFNKQLDEINKIFSRHASSKTRAMEYYNQIPSLGLREQLKEINERLTQQASFSTKAMETFNNIPNNLLSNQLKNINKKFSTQNWVYLAHQVSKQIDQPAFSPTSDDITMAAEQIKINLQEAALPSYNALTAKETIDALIAAVDKLSLQVTKTSTPSPKDACNTLSQSAKILITQLLCMIISSLITILFSATPLQSEAYEHKAMLNATRAHVKHQTSIKHVRIVKVNNSLNVRLRPNKKSRILGKLPRLAIVIAQSKTKKWTFIRYVEPNGSYEISGWVYSKYLCKGR